jgi:hypothetical protein
MSDLRERLQELAEAAARHGRTPGPQAALHRGRKRRLRLAAGTAAMLALVLLASLLGSDRLVSQPAPLAPPATTRPPATTASQGVPDASAPDVSISPEPGEVLKPAGSPPGKVGAGMVRDVASELTRCRGGDPDGPKVLVAWGRGHDQTWLIAAKPPRPGENWLCWNFGVFEASGAGGIGSRSGPDFPVQPLQASGGGGIRSGGQWWGVVLGTVSRQATRVRVLFRQGIAPLELVPIQAGDRFPVNFYAGFYRYPGRDTKLQGWITRVVAYDPAGRQVAECQATAGPGHSC